MTKGKSTKTALKYKPPILAPHSQIPKTKTGLRKHDVKRERVRDNVNRINYPVMRMSQRKLQALAALKLMFKDGEWGYYFIEFVLSELNIDEHLTHFRDEDIFHYYSSLATRREQENE